MPDLPNPESRVEQYLANLTDGTTEIPKEPESRIEQYLDYLAKNGGAGVNYGTAPAAAVGMALVAKTIVDGKVTEWEFGDAGGLKIHICTSSEYGQVSREPVISSPDEKTLYLVPAENGSSPDLFVEWAYVNNNWEMFGSASIDLSGFLTGVSVGGTAATVNNGVANIPVAGGSAPGVVKYSPTYGLSMSNGVLLIEEAYSTDIKNGNWAYRPICARRQHESTFYGLAKAAGDTTQSASSNTVGNYTDNAKAAIKAMLGVGGETQTVEVSGTAPVITANQNTRYVCGEVVSLDFTPSATGICDVRFTSGSTVAVLTIPNTVIFPEWFDPTSLDTDTTYEISISDGIYGAVMIW